MAQTARVCWLTGWLAGGAMSECFCLFLAWAQVYITYSAAVLTDRITPCIHVYSPEECLSVARWRGDTYRLKISLDCQHVFISLLLLFLPLSLLCSPNAMINRQHRNCAFDLHLPVPHIKRLCVYVGCHSMSADVWVMAYHFSCLSILASWCAFNKQTNKHTHTPSTD